MRVEGSLGRRIPIIPEFLPIPACYSAYYSHIIPRCTYYAQNYAGIMYQCLLVGILDVACGTLK